MAIYTVTNESVRDGSDAWGGAGDTWTSGNFNWTGTDPDTNNTNWIGYSSSNVATETKGAISFEGIAADSAATVNSATLRFRYITAYRQPRLQIHVETVDNSQPFSNSATAASRTISSTSALSQVLGTNNSGYSAVEDDEFIDVDVTSLVQEVINRPGWTSGNALSFILTVEYQNRGAWLFVYDTSNSAANGPTLDLDVSANPSLGLLNSGNLFDYDDNGIVQAGANLAAVDTVNITLGNVSTAQSNIVATATSVTFDVELGNLPTLKDVSVEYSTGGTSPVSITTQIQPITGNASVELVDPSTTQASILYNYSGPAPVTGDVIEYETTSQNGHTVSILENGFYSLSGGTTDDVIRVRRWSLTNENYETGGAGDGWADITIEGSGPPLPPPAEVDTAVSLMNYLMMGALR